MSFVVLYNGGGVGIGKVINGGFGMVCDGSEWVDCIFCLFMLWDVMGGVVCCLWVCNLYVMEILVEFNESYVDGYYIILLYIVEDDFINKVLKNKGIN